MVMLQLENILVVVAVVHVDAALLSSEASFGRSLLVEERSTGRSFRNSNPRQTSFLQI